MLTDEQKDVVREYYNDGIDPEDIAEEFGYDETDVMDYCAELLMEE